MRTVLILLGFLVTAVAIYLVVQREREKSDDEPMTLWGACRDLFIPLAAGLFCAVTTVRGLINGRVPCTSKGGGCKTDMFLRTEHTEQYWTHLGFFAAGAGLLLWLAWRGFRRWQASRG